MVTNINPPTIEVAELIEEDPRIAEAMVRKWVSFFLYLGVHYSPYYSINNKKYVSLEHHF